VLPIAAPEYPAITEADAPIAGRPDLVGSRTSLILGEGMTGITENAFINIKGTRRR
jgi:arylsulfatase